MRTVLLTVAALSLAGVGCRSEPSQDVPRSPGGMTEQGLKEMEARVQFEQADLERQRREMEAWLTDAKVLGDISRAEIAVCREIRRQLGSDAFAGSEWALCPEDLVPVMQCRQKEEAPTTIGRSSEPPDRLTRDEVKVGMRTVVPAVQRCGRGQTGMVVVRVEIAANGRVTSAEPAGEFANTPTGRCAARAVKSARFPKTQSPWSVAYPFKL